jgi:hypothetical protein
MDDSTSKVMAYGGIILTLVMGFFLGVPTQHNDIAGWLGLFGLLLAGVGLLSGKFGIIEKIILLLIIYVVFVAFFLQLASRRLFFSQTNGYSIIQLRS